ncbi:MAG: thiamine phosphate synthase [Faecousia sp.]
MKLPESMLRLYAVTDRSWTGKQTLYQQVESALKGGATCVQLREKDADPDTFLEEAIGLRELCRRYGIPLIINDNVSLAQKVGADGVHVGQDDMDPRQVRMLLGPDRIVGVTAKTVEQAVRAQQAGADYLGSGAVFGSTTKLNTRPMSPETLRQICQAVTIPVVAIGGINRQNILELQNTGIRGVAVVSGIFAAEDIEAECRHLRALAEKL